MQVARVAEIHRYPVKSMQGERLAASFVGSDGLRGDRAFAVRDEQRASLEGARKLPALLGCRARYGDALGDVGTLPAPEIEWPDGKRTRADAGDVARRLSALCGRELRLWPRVPAEHAEHYRRGAIEAGSMEEELRGLFARLPDEPLPDLAKFPREVLLNATLPGTYFDAYPLLLMSSASLAALAAARPESRFDARRFRPNLLLEVDGPGGFPENAWVGRRIRVGEVGLDVAMECPRCLMTTLPLAELPKDPKIMRTLVRENGGNLGVYAAVAKPGRIREGDAVRLL